MSLVIEKLLTLDNTGMPKAPSIRQIQDKDVLTLYSRDTSSDKSKYIAEVGVIYYIGDPQSPPRQLGFSREECLKAAIDNYNLDKSYKPDILVTRLIDKYYKFNIGETGQTLVNLRESIHFINKAVSKIRDMLDEKLAGAISSEEVSSILDLSSRISKFATEMPSLTIALKTAHDNLKDEVEEIKARGGGTVTSSMSSVDN